jgi:hypothetical protein
MLLSIAITAANMSLQQFEFPFASSIAAPLDVNFAAASLVLLSRPQMHLQMFSWQHARPVPAMSVTEPSGA